MPCSCGSPCPIPVATALPRSSATRSCPSLDLPALSGPPATATVVLGELGGVASPASVYTPIVGAEIVAAAGARVRGAARPEWEYALVGVEGVIAVTTGIAACRSGHRRRLGSTCSTSARGATRSRSSAPRARLIFLLGGEPFEDEIVMWWNFVGRSHEEIVEAREAWEAGAARFGHVVDHGDERVPAPPLPGVRLTRRQRRI